MHSCDQCEFQRSAPNVNAAVEQHPDGDALRSLSVGQTGQDSVLFLL